MPSYDILLIGAGAAGLVAARTLAQAGQRIAILEARTRAGGRIHTFADAGFTGPTEGGAEFLHGDVAYSRELLRAAGISTHDTSGKNYEASGGKAQVAAGFFVEDMPLLLQKLQALEHDVPLAEFLEQQFPDEKYRALRDTVTRFAEGYDAADARRASSFALREEWAGNGAEDSPRPEGGYGKLIAWLVQEIEAAAGVLHFSTVVEEVRWQAGHVEVVCRGGSTFTAAKVVLTLPLGVLQAEAGTLGHVRFTPELPAYRAAATALGVGPVIKFLLEFEEGFWQEPSADVGQPMPNMGFLFSDAAVPTWWSQLPDSRPLLTGWVAGPAAAALRETADAELLTLALNTLAYVFGSTTSFLRRHLRAHRVVNWGADPFARGAYAYATVSAAAAHEVLNHPVDNTLFFAGEGLYQGAHTGTVEAALVSGVDAAKRVLS
ncbi:NAD(P)-binding protein [Hymenobacter taeanensis]|uniref:Tryptophan 2-monooxygenase n=1 Tax=Hymenobacter taeanensis TaxID=2735321 RepID=A0A6M6BM95_9BACT|nr:MULTISPECIES: NAD(P)/FAD-dependent oxidoreductase [Hymenobacter]QJX49090.1 NAD(P)-binding protein [Hymenobacter taeanensis]UOQ81387.1 FAD-dependent oxidoreductase [Hymenobacter sp. 5414T-23]